MRAANFEELRRTAADPGAPPVPAAHLADRERAQGRVDCVERDRLISFKEPHATLIWRDEFFPYGAVTNTVESNSTVSSNE